jgi:hypothetical protein
MTEGAPITAADLRKLTWALRMHMRLAKGGFARVVGSVEFPRLTIRDGRQTIEEPIVKRVLVDGIECPTMAEVVERLNAPPPPQQKELPL